MAFFWQRKKEEKEKDKAQKKSIATKKDLVKKSNQPKKVSKTKAQQVVGKPTATGAAYRVLLGPVITEKTTRLAEQGTYAFEVAPGANKIDIAKAVAAVYGVQPVKVTKVKLPGKQKMFSQRSGMRSARYKAMVTLKEGQSIELFEKV